jgi:signal transduction histidine kinase
MVRRAESGIRERRESSAPDRRLRQVGSLPQGSRRPLRRVSIDADRRAIAPGPGRVPRVLLVDDRPEEIAALESALKPLAVKVLKARGTEEALLHLLRERFAAILLAVHLPRLDGLQTAELIYQREQTRDVPIIFVSALCREAAYAFRGSGQGSVDYVLQPVDPEILRTKVRVLCELWTQGEQIRGQTAQRELQDVFVASVAHAMRKELAAAKAAAQLAVDEIEDAGEPRSAGNARRIAAQIDRIAGLVSDLLHVSRVGVSLLAMHRTEVDLAAVAREVANRMQPLAERHRFVLRSPAPAPALVDRERIEQALTNLVAIALRYAPGGGPVDIGVQVLGDWVQVTVQGSGLGAGRDPQQRILQRSAHAYPDDAGGIGLATTRSIVERHGGRVWMEPGRSGEGSTFFVQLPGRRTT